MRHKDYELDVSGTGNSRDFTLVRLQSNFPLPQVISPVITTDDAAHSTPEGVFFRYVMKGNGLKEIRYLADTNAVRVTAMAEHAWLDMDFIETIVRCLINDHFNAAKKE